MMAVGMQKTKSAKSEKKQKTRLNIFSNLCILTPGILAGFLDKLCDQGITGKTWKKITTVKVELS